MTRSRRRALAAIALIVVLAGSAAAPSLADAETDASYADRMLGIDDSKATVSWLDATVAGTQGKIDGFIEMATTKTSLNHEVSPEGELREVQAFYNANSEEFLRYANSRVNATGDHNVVKITFQYENLEATRYLVAEVENGNYTSARIQASPSNVESYTELEDGTYMVRLNDGSIEHRETVSATVDDTLTLQGQAVDNAPQELEKIHDKFIEANEDASVPYLIRVGAHYQGDVNSTLIGGAGA